MTHQTATNDRERPLRWWSADQLAEVALALEKALRGWELDWGLQQSPDVQGAVQCTLAFEAAVHGAAWRSVALDDTVEHACELWWGVGDLGEHGNPVLLLVDALFNSSRETSALSTHTAVGEMASEAAGAAWNDLWCRIGRALAIAPSITAPQPDALALRQPHQPLFRPWSGALAITLHWCGREMRVLLGGAEASELLATRRGHGAVAGYPTSSPLVPVWHAVAGLTSTLRAELGPVQLTLGALKGLRVGDVIELPHPLDQPLAAKADGGETLCEAFLGKVGSHRAIELLAPPVRACNTRFHDKDPS